MTEGAFRRGLVYLLTLSERTLPVAQRLSGKPIQSGPTPVDGWETLQKVVDLPISTWSYIFDPPGVRHIGPMAQDWAERFGMGGTERAISMIDANGVLLVCVQALHRRIEALEAEVARLRTLDGGG